MASTTDAVLAFIVAAAIAWVLVPPAERLARRIGAIDYPRDRGLHDAPTPKLSGLAILAAVEVAGWIWLPGDGESRSILLGAAAIALVGVLDDVYDLPALPKLLGQMVAALIPVLGGVRVDALTLPFIGGFELGWVAYPGTVLAIVAIVNVTNFIDGVDGLAAGVCAIAALALAIIALSLDRNAAGVLAALTAGAALGFLRHGFPPASSFMGDTGSNLLGYLLATAAIQGALKTNAVVAFAFPLVRARGADPRQRLRRRQAAQVPPADLPGRPVPLPPPDGQHRLLAAAHPRLPLRLDADPRGSGARAALRPLQRQPRPFQRRLDRGDGRLRPRRAGGQHLPASTCSRSSSCGGSGGASCAASASRPGVPSPTRRRSTEASRKSWKRGPSRLWIPRPASSRRSVPSGRIRRPDGAAERAAGQPPFGYSRPAASAGESLPS